MAENFNKRLGTIGSEQAPFYCSRYNFRLKQVFAKLLSTAPGEHFQPLLWNIKTSEAYSDFEQTVFGTVNITAFYLSEGTFWCKKFLAKKINSWKFFWQWANSSRILNEHFLGIVVKTILHLSIGRFCEKKNRIFIDEFFWIWKRSFRILGKNIRQSI